MTGPVFHMYHMRARPDCEEYAFYEACGPYTITVRSPDRDEMPDYVFVEMMRGDGGVMNVQQNMTLANVANIVNAYGRVYRWPCRLADVWYGYVETDPDLIVAMIGRRMVEDNRIEESLLRDAYLEMRRSSFR